MNVSCPALLITAPASGHGKTSLTAALARYHSRKGLRVRCFKTGPDFIDPTLLARASGQAVYNLDTWMMGEDHCRRLLYEAALESDLILVEGVMGLFDGTPSSADLAELFGLPIVPVIDASSMAQTFAAVLHGLATFRSTLKLAGAVANRVASPRHAELLQTGLPQGFKLAKLPRNAEASLPSRHLGLQLAHEIEDIDTRLDRLADALNDTWLAELPDKAPGSQAPAWEPGAWEPDAKPPCRGEFIRPGRFPHPSPLPEGEGDLTQALLEPELQGLAIAIAKDSAFCFLYAQNLNLLESLGAELVFFSPLTDAKLPKADAIYLPGGYPELYADRLSQNLSLKQDIQAHVAEGKPMLAECGGMLYLAETLLDMDGHKHEMLGVLPGCASMHAKLSGIGPQQIELEGQVLRGHTFHYSSFETPLEPVARAQTQDGRVGEAVYRTGSVIASYLHLYFPYNPEAAARLFLN